MGGMDKHAGRCSGCVCSVGRGGHEVLCPCVHHTARRSQWRTVLCERDGSQGALELGARGRGGAARAAQAAVSTASCVRDRGAEPRGGERRTAVFVGPQ